MRVCTVEMLEEPLAQLWSGTDQPSSKKLPGTTRSWRRTGTIPSRRLRTVTLFCSWRESNGMDAGQWCCLAKGQRIGSLVQVSPTCIWPQEPSEENSLLVRSLTQETRKFNFYNLNQRAGSIFPQPEEVQNSVSCFSRKFPNHQAKAQLRQGRVGSFYPPAEDVCQNCK